MTQQTEVPFTGVVAVTVSARHSAREGTAQAAATQVLLVLVHASPNGPSSTPPPSAPLLPWRTSAGLHRSKHPDATAATTTFGTGQARRPYPSCFRLTSLFSPSSTACRALVPAPKSKSNSMATWWTQWSLAGAAPVTATRIHRRTVASRFSLWNTPRGSTPVPCSVSPKP